MVLESLVNPWGAKKHPFMLFFLGLIFSSIAVLFSLWVFKQQASLVMVFLTVVISIPLMFATLEEEEEEDWREKEESTILKEHSKSILFLTCLFLGFVIGFALWYLFLPATVVSQVFQVQLETINSINSQVVKLQGSFIDSGLAMHAFVSILANNMKVLIFCIFFAFFFGAGSIFILAWNASVISAAMGTYFRNSLANYAGVLGFSKVAIYLQVFSMSLMRYMIHGIFEIIAYFIGGLAGGILSTALINHGVSSERFKNVLYDVLILTLIAVGFLVVGAGIETFITPTLFH